MKVRLILPAVALGAALLLGANSAEAGLFGGGCGVADCCAPAPSCGCGHGHGHGLFHKLRHGFHRFGDCGCGAPAACCDVIEPACGIAGPSCGLPAPSCGLPAPTCGVADVGCGCEPACGHRHFGGLGHKLRHWKHRLGGCGCGCAVEPACGVAAPCCGM